MAEQKVANVSGQEVTLMTGANTPTPGSTGLKTQLDGQATTVSEVANSTGGIGAGNFVETDIDDELAQFYAGDTPLMQLMLKAKKVKVDSPVVQHFQIDEPRAVITLKEKIVAKQANVTALPLDVRDQSLPRLHQTLLVKDVDGYEADGATKQVGQGLQLYVTGTDPVSNNPLVSVVNGPKTSPADEYCTIPDIPAGATIVCMSTAMYETQKHVPPSTTVPQPSTIYLQKRGMTNIVSDYFDAQKKRIPFTSAIIAEAQIKEFKIEGNRTLWAGKQGLLKVKTDKMGMQYVYFTKGIRWQFKRELQMSGKWTVEKVIALTKMYYTSEDKPEDGVILAGKNFIENIQCVDFSKHPEVQIVTKRNVIGWEVTSISTIFGDIDIKYEPTLDRLQWSNSAAILSYGRLVHYVYSNEHSYKEDIEGEEAKRTGTITWDALALKGTCHIWIDGEGNSSSVSAMSFVMWESTAVPTGKDLVDGRIYYFMQDMPAIAAGAKAGEVWMYKGTKWTEYSAEMNAQ